MGEGNINNVLADLINSELINRNMVDITPARNRLTWSNDRVGDAYIAKRLDRVFIHFSLIDKLGLPKLSVENVMISDHFPILLLWPDKIFRRGYSFKFDNSILLNPVFNLFVQTTWKEIKDREKTKFIFSSSREKLSEFRDLVKKWQFQRHQEDKADLNRVQQELESIMESTDFSSCSLERKACIRALEKGRFCLLKQEEEKWRLKIRATWLELGDKNTKFFHKFANARRERNFIWKIKDDQGNEAISQEDITRLAVSFFQKSV